MREPKGISIELGLNSRMTPSLCVYPQQFCNLRPVAVRSNKPGWVVPEMVRNTYGGIKIDFLIGTVARPVSKVWDWDNPWTSGKHWLVLRIPVLPAFFISVGFGKRGKQWGFYVGCKTYRVDKISNAGKWAQEEEMGNIYLCPSASVRQTMWD